MSGSGSVNATVKLETPPTTQVDLGLDDISLQTRSSLTVEPLTAQLNSDLSAALETRSALALEPVTANVNGDLSVDVKPVVFDLRVSLGKIVPVYVRLPYRHHFGITLFGIELLGFTVHGESQVDVQDTPPPPP